MNARGTNWPAPPHRGVASSISGALRGGFALVLAVLLSGCAGGWRNGEGPASPASAPASAPAAAISTGQQARGAVTFVWKGGGNQVFLAGTFNEWKPDAEPMTRQADGSFTLARDLAPGSHAYKFVVDGAWKEDPDAKEFVSDDYGGRNSVIVVGDGASPGAAAPGAAAASASGRPPQVTADGVTFTYAGAANTVALAGDFNAWATNADPMTKQADGAWTVTKKLAPGTYAYKFLIDGATWKHDDANPQTRDDSFGGKNSVVTVP